MSVEDIKKKSKRLRGDIEPVLQSDSSKFEEQEYQLLKFHGTYQQDNRDLRQQLRKEGKERAYSFMVRSKIPGGRLTAQQYLVHDHVAGELGNGSLRITSRQGFQLHFILKGDLKSCIAQINECGLTTWGACGDVVRNVMASPAPIDSPAHRDIQALSEELKDVFGSQSNAYSEIWLDGEKLDLGQGEEEEPIYGEAYLPRKFKIGIAIPPRNDVDIYTQDIGLIPQVENDQVLGYHVLVGGGFGMSHGKAYTYPALGKPLYYVAREHVVEVCKAIVTTQRDHGNRENRKQARMKYLVDKMGIDWMRDQVRSRVSGDVAFHEAQIPEFDTTGDPLGWHEQGDGQLFCSVWIPEGRIQDTDEGNYRSAFREIAETMKPPMRLTPNCNIIFHDLAPSQQQELNAILEKHNIAAPETLTEARRLGMACVAMPTCGLALAESERVFQGLLDKIDVHLRELGLENDNILIRMTGCPNGCARPYNADFAFVGKSPGKYVFFVGGSYRGDRLAGLEKKMVDLDDIPGLVRTYLDEYVANRLPGESFSDYWGRTHRNGAAPSAEQFHQEGWQEAAKESASH